MRKAKKQDWRKIRDLYKHSFPRQERKPFSFLRVLQLRGHGQFWVFEDKEGDFAGFAFTVTKSDLVLLDYLAISEQFRGSGIGSDALSLIKQRYRYCKLILEVEDPDEEGCTNTAQREKRLSFYAKNDILPTGLRVNIYSTQMLILMPKGRVSYNEYSLFLRETHGMLMYRRMNPTEIKN